MKIESFLKYWCGGCVKKIKVLFICSQNSSRSQMAEAFLKSIDVNNRFHVESAGIDKGVLHLPTIFTMQELGILKGLISLTM